MLKSILPICRLNEFATKLQYNIQWTTDMRSTDSKREINYMHMFLPHHSHNKLIPAYKFYFENWWNNYAPNSTIELSQRSVLSARKYNYINFYKISEPDNFHLDAAFKANEELQMYTPYLK